MSALSARCDDLIDDGQKIPTRAAEERCSDQSVSDRSDFHFWLSSTRSHQLSESFLPDCSCNKQPVNRQ